MKIRSQKFTYIRFFIWLSAGILAAGCANSNRPSHITSIGHEDLTRKKPVNVIVYRDERQEDQQENRVFDQNAKIIIAKLKELHTQNELNLNNATTHNGNWLEVADNYFSADNYNWVIRLPHADLPEIKFQNFSTDIDSSIEVHFRYCKERTIQFANIPSSQLSIDREHWSKQFYPLAIYSLYLLMKGNTELVPVAVRDYQGKTVSGTLLGETDDYRFILDGETRIYIASKTGS